MTIGLIVYAFIVLFLAMQVPAVSFSPVSDAQFQAVFGQSMWIIVGSVIAFALSQMIDVFIFWLVRHQDRRPISLDARHRFHRGLATDRQHRHHRHRFLAAGQGARPPSFWPWRRPTIPSN